MLAALTVLLVCQLVGESLVVAFRLPVPGPVLGMALLFVALGLRGRVSDDLRDTANGLLRHLSLLFVPAGVGVMVYLPLLMRDWPSILAAVVVGTAVGIAFTARLAHWLLSRKEAKP